jgi:hypothetical protein
MGSESRLWLSASATVPAPADGPIRGTGLPVVSWCRLGSGYAFLTGLSAFRGLGVNTNDLIGVLAG